MVTLDILPGIKIWVRDSEWRMGSLGSFPAPFEDSYRFSQRSRLSPEHQCIITTQRVFLPTRVNSTAEHDLTASRQARIVLGAPVWVHRTVKSDGLVTLRNKFIEGV